MRGHYTTLYDNLTEVVSVGSFSVKFLRKGHTMSKTIIKEALADGKTTAAGLAAYIREVKDE